MHCDSAHIKRKKRFIFYVPLKDRKNSKETASDAIITRLCWSGKEGKRNESSIIFIILITITAINVRL